MAILFVPRPLSFNGVVAGGAGVINQWVYTVPAGKRAELVLGYCEVQDNANAVNTCIADIFIIEAGIAVTYLKQYNDGAGNNTLTPNISLTGCVPLSAGSTVTGRTQNTGAAGVLMLVRAIIKEYQ